MNKKFYSVMNLLIAGISDGTAANGSTAITSNLLCSPPIPPWEWMKTIRNGPNDLRPAASFYFPDHLAGPDLMFALEHGSDSSDRILCVVQVSFGPEMGWLLH